jgi:hypothetical protein
LAADRDDGIISATVVCWNMKMASNIETKALSIIEAFERSGKKVSRVILDGRRIEVELVCVEDQDSFAHFDMRYGKA